MKPFIINILKCAIALQKHFKAETFIQKHWHITWEHPAEKVTSRLQRDALT